MQFFECLRYTDSSALLCDNSCQRALDPMKVLQVLIINCTGSAKFNEAIPEITRHKNLGSQEKSKSLHESYPARLRLLLLLLGKPPTWDYLECDCVSMINSVDVTNY